MEKFRVIGSFVIFLLLAGISCWATEKSLYMLLPAGWPEILVWGITIAFFVMASIGTKLIVDALSTSTFEDNRHLKLFGGIVLLFFFWLLMSMPTNTHTFFYNDQIGSVVTKDIQITQKYLDQLVNKGTSGTWVLDSVGQEMYNQVEDERTHIVAQFNGQEPPYKSGNGKVIGKHLRNINGVLNSNLVQDSRFNSTDPAILNKYQIEINKALESALKTHTISTAVVGEARNQSSKLGALNDSIQQHLSTNSLEYEEILQCQAELENGYKIIATNKTFVDFDPKTDDEELYTRDIMQTRTKRLSSVIDVFFVDFMGGKYPGSFWYFIILSVLLDVAAFIFFDIAFKKCNDNF